MTTTDINTKGRMIDFSFLTPGDIFMSLEGDLCMVTSEFGYFDTNTDNKAPIKANAIELQTGKARRFLAGYTVYHYSSCHFTYEK